MSERPGVRTVVAAAALAVIATGALLPAGPASAQAPVACPAPLPLEEVQRGMTGTGYTVTEGRTVEPFAAEVLGVMLDAVGPGRDMIVVQTSGAAIEEVGGIWFGMSGSPVYVGDRLLGALAFGLSFGPSTIAGLTPAKDVFEVLRYPSESTDTGFRRARLSRSLRQRIATRTGVAADEVGGSLIQLKMPLAASGLNGRALGMLSSVVRREGLPLAPYAAGSAQGEVPPASAEPPPPGGTLAAALSYGDITLAGVGTTTLVCEGKVMGFGHPFLFEGDTAIGANAADTLAIVDDPFGPYKLARIAETIGTLDQDRFAGIRATLGPVPAVIPIRSTVTAVDLGRTRSGETDAMLNESVPFLSFIHLLTNLDFTRDEFGEGSSSLSWSIAGTTSSGTSWQLDRSNMFASEQDISYESIAELQTHMFTLLFNDFEDVEFSSVDVTASVDDDVTKYSIANVLVSTDAVNYQDVRKIRVRPRSYLYVRAVLEPYDGTEDKLVDLIVRVPRGANPEGTLEISGGSAGGFAEPCFFEGGECGRAMRRIESFEELIASLEQAPTNNEARARLRMGARGLRTRDSEVLDQVVDGFEIVRIIIEGSGCCARGEPVDGPAKGY